MSKPGRPGLRRKMPGGDGGQAFFCPAAHRVRAAGQGTIVQMQPTPPATPDGALESLTQTLRQFAAERDWGQFHSPKNLACALSVEAAELLEHFQWLTEQQSDELAPEKRAEVGQELADVLLYLLQLADRLQIDLVAAARRKLELNAARYPVAQARGSSRKYSEL